MSSSTPDKPLYLTEHLRELRVGLVRSLGIAGIGIGLAFWRSDLLFRILLAPFHEALAHFPELSEKVRSLQTLAPIEAFMVNMKVATFVGLALASPWILREIWVFAAPALKPHERAGILMIFSLGLFFFAGGIYFGYAVIVPLALNFLIRYNLDYQFIPQWTLQGYFSFVVNFLLVFGLVFELPLLLAGLVAIGVATPAFLVQKWRQAVIGIFVLAAFIAPSADPITQTLVAVPLIALYVVGIGLSYLIVRKK